MPSNALVVVSSIPLVCRVMYRLILVFHLYLLPLISTGTVSLIFRFG